LHLLAIFRPAQPQLFMGNFNISGDI